MPALLLSPGAWAAAGAFFGLGGFGVFAAGTGVERAGNGVRNAFLGAAAALAIYYGGKAMVK